MGVRFLCVDLWRAYSSYRSDSEISACGSSAESDFIRAHVARGAAVFRSKRRRASYLTSRKILASVHACVRVLCDQSKGLLVAVATGTRMSPPPHITPPVRPALAGPGRATAVMRGYMEAAPLTDQRSMPASAHAHVSWRTKPPPPCALFFSACRSCRSTPPHSL